jgi:hypothetical protein
MKPKKGALARPKPVPRVKKTKGLKKLDPFVRAPDDDEPEPGSDRAMWLDQDRAAARKAHKLKRRQPELGLCAAPTGCVNKRHRHHAKYCEGHAALDRRIEGVKVIRASLYSARVLIRHAADVNRDEVFGDQLTERTQTWDEAFNAMAEKLATLARKIGLDWTDALPKAAASAAKAGGPE